MTLHLPSRQVVVAAGVLAVVATVGVWLTLNWRLVFGWLVALGLLRWRYGRRGRRTLLESLALAGGGLAGLLGLRAEGRRRAELHAAKVATEQARAEELRSRAEHRVRMRAEQAKAERAAYWRGAADGS